MKSHSAAPAVLQCCAVIRADAMMRELLLVLSYNVTDAFGSSSIFRAIISSAVELAFSRRRRSRNSSHCFESGARRTRSLCPCTPLDHAHTKSMVLSIGVQALPRNPHAFFRHEFFNHSMCLSLAHCYCAVSSLIYITSAYLDDSSPASSSKLSADERI